ncbi:MAG: flagellin [Alphaproteobacteria bacterium]|nr:flagellin [Alphaproteobacteria bacterium]
MLISDSSYNGVNLLLNQNLQLFFNENRSSSLTIEGKDATAQGLGLEEVNWYGVEDVTITINQVDEAINKLRIFSENFSNTYSTISNRLSFTENLINILEEGSDKLTLADMNEESANMLALQVRQQLGINSLSLASEAANSILKLFS